MSRTIGHGKRTKQWGEAWGRRASFAGIVGWWLDAMAKRITRRAERRRDRVMERAVECPTCGEPMRHGRCPALAALEHNERAAPRGQEEGTK